MQSTTINRPITLLKVFYFLYFAAAAAIYPFLTLFYESLGLTGRQIGILAAIPPLVMLFAASFWGGLADATQQHRRLLGGAIIGGISFALLVSVSSSFWSLAVTITGFAFLIAPIIPLIDNSALECLGERKNQYGKLRAWGAIGWGVAGPIIGWLMEQLGLRWSFYGYALFMAAGFLITFHLPITQSSIGKAFWGGFRVLTGNRRWLFFLAIMFVTGVGSGVVHNYLFLYMDYLGATTTLMGLALTVATLSELVIFSFSDRLLDRWGIRLVLVVSIIAMIVRYLAYSLISIPWLVLPIQLLHGFTFSARWAAGVAYANKIAPAGMGATAQGIFSGVMLGLGGAGGGLIGGWLYESASPVLMFRWAGLGILAAVVLLALVGKFVVELNPAPAKT
jgi:PPP family 3-phenylpropionic acid transporter